MRAFFVLAVVLLAGCTAEGNSLYLGASGQVTRYASMSICEKEASSMHPDNGPSRYVGYECRQLLLDRWVVDIKRYSDGALVEDTN